MAHGWSPKGDQPPKGEWSYDLRKGWSPPEQQDSKKGTQFIMPPGFDPKKRGAGWQALISPPGVEAPVDRINYNPKTKELFAPGASAPISDTQISLLPDTSGSVPLIGDAPPVGDALQTDPSYMPEFDMESLAYQLMQELSPPEPAPEVMGVESQMQDPSMAVGVGADGDNGRMQGPAIPEWLQAPGRFIASIPGAINAAVTSPGQGATGSSGYRPPRSPSPANVQRVFPVDGVNTPVGSHWGVEGERGGTDIFAARGTPVRAMVSGVVSQVATQGLGGNVLTISGDDGHQYYYAHLDQPPPVRQGQRVEAGVQVGAVGDTGNARGKGHHLHIGIGQSTIYSGNGVRSGTGDADAVQILNSAARPYVTGRPAEGATPPPGGGTPANASSGAVGGSWGGNAANVNPRDLVMVAGAQAALSRGLGPTGAAVVQAILQTEAGWSGGVGDRSDPRSAVGSHGPLQFFGGQPGSPGQLNNFAREKGMNLQQAAQYVRQNPVEAINWAVRGYLGNAIKAGMDNGLTGAALATYAQNAGQGSRNPERSGTNYQNMFGQGQPLQGTPEAAAVLGSGAPGSQTSNAMPGASNPYTNPPTPPPSPEVIAEILPKTGEGGATTRWEPVYASDGTLTGYQELRQSPKPDPNNLMDVLRDEAGNPVMDWVPSQNFLTPAQVAVKDTGKGVNAIDIGRSVVMVNGEGQVVSTINKNEGEDFRFDPQSGQGIFFNAATGTTRTQQIAPPTPMMMNTARGVLDQRTGQMVSGTGPLPIYQQWGRQLLQIDPTGQMAPTPVGNELPVGWKYMQTKQGGWVAVNEETNETKPIIPDPDPEYQPVATSGGGLIGYNPRDPHNPVDIRPDKPSYQIASGPRGASRAVNVNDPNQSIDIFAPETSYQTVQGPRGAARAFNPQNPSDSIELFAGDPETYSIGRQIIQRDPTTRDFRSVFEAPLGFEDIKELRSGTILVPGNVNIDMPAGWASGRNPGGGVQGPIVTAPDFNPTAYSYSDEGQRGYVGGGQDVKKKPVGWGASEPIQVPNLLQMGQQMGGPAAPPPEGWAPPVPEQSVVGTGNKFGQPVDMEGVHKGLDLQAVRGTPATSPVDGTVVSVEQHPEGLGLQVHIQDTQGQVHVLSHLENAAVQPGDPVKMGQPVGAVGSSGAGSTGPHMDYRVQGPQGEYRNPEPLAGELAQMPQVTSAPPQMQGQMPMMQDEPPVGTGASGSGWGSGWNYGTYGSGFPGMGSLYPASQNDYDDDSLDISTPLSGRSQQSQPYSTDLFQFSGNQGGGDAPEPEIGPAGPSLFDQFRNYTGGTPMPNGGWYNIGSSWMQPDAPEAGAPQPQPASGSPVSPGPNNYGLRPPGPGRTGNNLGGNPSGGGGDPDAAIALNRQYAQAAAASQQADKTYQLQKAQLDQEWRMHQDDDKYRRDKMALDEAYRQKQLQIQQQEQELDRQMQLLLQGSFAQRSQFELAQGALRNPWLQQLSGMTPGWAQAGGPGSGNTNPQGIVIPQGWRPGLGIGGDVGAGADITPYPDYGANGYGSSMGTNPAQGGGNPPGWAGVEGQTAAIPYSSQATPYEPVPISSGTPASAASQSPAAQPYSGGINFGLNGGGIDSSQPGWQSGGGLSAYVPGGSNMGSSLLNVPAAPTMPSWEEYSALSPFQRAAMRVQAEMAGVPWEQFTNQMREKWAAAGGPTTAPGLTRLEGALQDQRGLLGRNQIAETFGLSPDEYWQGQQRGWAPSKASAVSLVT